MEGYFYELDRLFFVCSKYSNLSYNLKGFVFNFKYKLINDKWLSKEKQHKHVFKRYGFKVYIKFLVYRLKVWSYQRYYKESSTSIKVIEDNSSLWRYYAQYDKINVKDKTILEPNSITLDNHLFIER